MSLNNFGPLTVIGKGSFGIVYRAVRKADAKLYAIKTVPFQTLKIKEQANALNEVRLLACIFSPYIIRFYQAFMEDGNLHMVMDYLKGGDLFTRLHMHYKPRGIFLPEAQVWRASIHLLRALNLLHSHGICHRDVKSQNVFLTSHGEYVLGDFNVAKLTQDRLMETQTGTPYYASPEVWNMEAYSTKSDVWSLGCLIYQICTHSPPFTGQKIQDLKKSVHKGSYPRIPSQYSESLAQFIQLFLQHDPSTRYSPGQILALSVVKKMIKKYSLEDHRPATIILQDLILQEEHNQPLNLTLPKPNYGPLKPQQQPQGQRMIRSNSSANYKQQDGKDYWMRITFGKEQPTPLRRPSSSHPTPKRQSSLTARQNTLKQPPYTAVKKQREKKVQKMPSTLTKIREKERERYEKVLTIEKPRPRTPSSKNNNNISRLSISRLKRSSSARLSPRMSSRPPSFSKSTKILQNLCKNHPPQSSNNNISKVTKGTTLHPKRQIKNSRLSKYMRRSEYC